MLVEIKGMINLGTLNQHVFALAAGITLVGDVLIIINRFGPIYTYVIL